LILTRNRDLNQQLIKKGIFGWLFKGNKEGEKKTGRYSKKELLRFGKIHLHLIL